MAKQQQAQKTLTIHVRLKKPKKRRPGVHSVSKTSKLKKSKNYRKLSRGQG